MLEESMNTGLIPIKMSSATVEFDQFTPGWSLADIDEVSAAQPRRFISRVTYESPFSFVPVVQVGITGFDVDHRDSARLSVRAEAISAESFDIVVQTWENSRVYKVEVSWLALGQ